MPDSQGNPSVDYIEILAYIIVQKYYRLGTSEDSNICNMM